MSENTQDLTQTSAEAVAELVRSSEEEARYLIEWGAGESLIAAARLRPFYGREAGGARNDISTGAALAHAHAAIQDAHQARAAWLCAEYRRILHGPVDPAWSGQPLALQRVRCFSAAYRDLELAFLCVAHLWHTMRSGYAGAPRQQRAAVDEARQVLAPLLQMLGMLSLRVEMEEQTVAAERRPLELDEAARQAGAAIAAELADVLRTQVPGALVYPNRYAQIHNSQIFGRNAPKLSLLPTITVLVDDEAACYQVLHQVHKLYTPVDGGIDDSLFAPDDSGYRALNVWVVANAATGRARISFSIAPRSQHEINEWGAAAHLMRYRDQTPTPTAWWERAAEALPEKLYVFSPRGELFAFDRGCTVVDFAYSVHSEVAEQCRSFIVNGRPVEPATLLRHLDLVELEHDPQAPGPTRFWLAAARTARARNAIERSLKRKGQGSHHGQKIIEDRLKQLELHYGFNLPAAKVEQAIADAVRKENLNRREDLLAAVASGQLAADSLLHRLFEREVLRRVIVPRQVRLRHHQLFLAQCCRPRPGDEIVGRLYRRHGEVVHMTLHRHDCSRIAGLDDLMPIKWRIEPSLTILASWG
jgi:GTP pyrophosphokinase